MPSNDTQLIDLIIVILAHLQDEIKGSAGEYGRTPDEQRSIARDSIEEHVHILAALTGKTEAVLFACIDAAQRRLYSDS